MQIINFLGDIFNLILLQPTVNLIILILRVLEQFHVPGALGFAIIILTGLVVAISWPFKSSQIRHTKKTADKMTELRPLFDELKEKHKDNKMAFNQAKTQLLQEHGVNPAAGCLPSLIPILFIWPLYQLIFALVGEHNGLEKINYFLYSKDWYLSVLPNPNFFGVNLAHKPSEFATAGFFLLLIPILTAVLTFIQSKMMTPIPVKEYPSDSPKEKKEKESMEDAMVSMQGQMIYFIPLIVGFYAFQFPVGLSLYWNVLTFLGIIQQYKISGWGGFVPILNRIGMDVSQRAIIADSRPNTKVTIERKKKR